MEIKKCIIKTNKCVYVYTHMISSFARPGPGASARLPARCSPGRCGLERMVRHVLTHSRD